MWVVTSYSGLYYTLQCLTLRRFIQCAHNKGHRVLKGLIRLRLASEGGCIQKPLQANEWYVGLVLTSQKEV
jgi:hypothetical protein